MIPAMQRDDFADYLRRLNVVRVMSHEVARTPGRWWMFTVGVDGWVRAYILPDHPEDRHKARTAMLRSLREQTRYAGKTPISYMVIRWKVDPQPGPNAWERRVWNPGRRRYETRQ